MTPDPQMAERAERAQKITADPSQYKVCEGCESIVVARVSMCPNCHGYRFDETAERVVEQAKILGNRPRTSVLVSDLE